MIIVAEIALHVESNEQRLNNVDQADLVQQASTTKISTRPVVVVVFGHYNRPAVSSTAIPKIVPLSFSHPLTLI